MDLDNRAVQSSSLFACCVPTSCFTLVDDRQFLKICVLTYLRNHFYTTLFYTVSTWRRESQRGGGKKNNYFTL